MTIQEGIPDRGGGPNNTNAQSRYAFPQANPYARMAGPPKLQFGEHGELTRKTIEQAGLVGEERKRAISDLGTHLMAAVGRIVPVVPVPLITSVFLQNEKPLSELELKSGVEQLIEKLEAADAHVYIPRKDLDYAVTVGLRMLTLRRLVEEKDGLYAVRPAELPLIRYYANSIAHLG